MAPAGPGSLKQYAAPDVPTIVHNLIRDMKALEAALHRWSCAQASPEDVSNCYVQFGVEFNAVVHAFEGYDIPTRYATQLQSLSAHRVDASNSDLHAIPTQLRSALEECLGEGPTLDALDHYLPEIRRLLREVLQGLRAKQPAWRSAAGRPRTAASNRSYSPGLSSSSFP